VKCHLKLHIDITFQYIRSGANAPILISPAGKSARRCALSFVTVTTDTNVYKRLRLFVFIATFAVNKDDVRMVTGAVAMSEISYVLLL